MGRKTKWFRLDNAALIFPAAMRRGWNNAFRVSVTLTEPVDIDCLRKAAESMRDRFPTFFVRLRTGVFWYYLEEITQEVPIREEYAYPLTPMSRKDLRRSCIRILYYGSRIAVEFFHAVTDGTGGMVFVKNLTAAYLRYREQADIPCTNGILDMEQAPLPEETRDLFPLLSGPKAMGRGEENACRLGGEKEPDGFRHLITGIVPTDSLLEKAHACRVSVTAFLCAVMAESIARLQAKQVREKHWKPVKITVPVNLRRVFGQSTLRNFALTVNVGYDPGMGEYTLEEIAGQISHQLAWEIVPQRMAARIAANVNPQKIPLICALPLFIKNPVMRSIYLSSERKGCLNISNLGNVELPAEMTSRIRRLQFIIGVQASYPNNCSVVSWNGKTYINMIRNVKSAELERLFFSRLVEIGIPVEIESNNRREKECTV
ncbi:MAG: hypothetical protein II781_02945 [Clostridia bacterium]|nr:hypothetical protein [Clostridia bacterium]